MFIDHGLAGAVVDELKRVLVYAAARRESDDFVINFVDQYFSLSLSLSLATAVVSLDG